MKVAKFGGSSLATAEQVTKVCDIVAAEPHERRVVVVSAPGKRYDGDTKVTDLLINCAEQYLAHGTAEDELAEVVDRYHGIQEGLGLPYPAIEEVTRDLRARLSAPASSREQFIDRMKAAGEDNCAKLVAQTLCHRGVDACYASPQGAGLLLSNEAGNARVLPESYDNLRALRNAREITVFPGFFGHTHAGEVVTFKRGGSDITGSIVARAVEADLYENFTDVDSVSVVDPRIIPAARPIGELTYREMRELSYNGFDVFNDEALAPVAEVGIPVRIKNTNRPDAAGTLISRARSYTPGQAVGIASKDGFCTIFVSKYLMNREIGFGRRLLQILEKENIAYEHAPTGIDDISVIVRQDGFDEDVADRVVARIKGKLQPNVVTIERGFALVMVVGEGIRETPGIAARATGALAEANINIEMMNQGGSEISMMFGVRAEKREAAVRALYQEFFCK